VASRTVIFTDLIFNLPASARKDAPVFFWLLDAPGKFGPHRFIRARAIRGRAAARQSVDRILRWDFRACDCLSRRCGGHRRAGTGS
jgi:hypothetical protein